MLPHHAHARSRLHERTQSFRNAKNGAQTIGSSIESRPVKHSIRALSRSAYGIFPVQSMEAMQRGQLSLRRNLEYRAVIVLQVGPAKISVPVEVPVRA